MKRFIVLAGRQPRGDYLRICSQAMPKISDGRAITMWASAQKHTAALMQRQAAEADGAQVLKMPRRYAKFAERLYSEYLSSTAFSGIKTRLGMVELDKLVVFQHAIDLDHIKFLSRANCGHLTEQDATRIALSPGAPPHAAVSQNSPTLFTFSAPSRDFRCLDRKLVEAKNVEGVDFFGRPVYYIITALGYSANAMLVININSRIILMNGYHRAYFLKKHGFTRSAAVILDVQAQDEAFASILQGTADLERNPRRYIHDPRPPMLKDYFDSKLITKIFYPNECWITRLRFETETFNAPAAL